MQNTKFKLIAAALVAGIGVLGVTQIASAQTALIKSTPAVTSQARPAQTTDVAEVADTTEAGDPPDVAGAADTSEAGDVADAAEPAVGADTDQVQAGNQSGPDAPDAPGSSTN